MVVGAAAAVLYMFCISPAVAAVMMPDVMHLCHMEDDRPAAPFSLSGSFPVLMRVYKCNKKSYRWR